MTDPRSYTGIALDAAAVRVLAHPLRSRILSRLRLDGPATATELANLLTTNTGATSYHLRKLGSVGLVTDTGEGEGKRRQWRATTTFHSFRTSDFRGDEDATTAAGWLERDYLRRLASRAEEWLDVAAEWPDAWVDQLGMNDTFVVVTPDQYGALRAELDEVLARYREAGRDDPAGRRIQLYDYALPADVTPPGATGAPDSVPTDLQEQEQEQER